MSLSDFSALVRYFLVLAFLVLSGLCMPGRAFQSVLFPPHPPLALREKGPVCGFFAFHFALFGTFGTSSHFSLPHPPPLFLFSFFFFFSSFYRLRREKDRTGGRREERGKGRTADETCRTTGLADQDDEDENDDDHDVVADETCRTTRK